MVVADEKICCKFTALLYTKVVKAIIIGLRAVYFTREVTKSKTGYLGNNKLSDSGVYTIFPL